MLNEFRTFHQSILNNIYISSTLYKAIEYYRIIQLDLHLMLVEILVLSTTTTKKNTKNMCDLKLMKDVLE